MFTLTFWRATLERVLSSIAGGALAALGSDALGVFDVDFGKVASVALLAGLVSLLKALIVGKVTDGGPSIGNTETLNPAAPKEAVAVPVEDAKPPTYSGDSKTDATFHDGSGFVG
jgi:hypothetical protein